MKLKKVRALMIALTFTVGTALCVSTVAWAKSLNTPPVSIINEQGEFVKSAIQFDRTLYFGSKQTQDIQSKILAKLCSEDTIKEDKLTANDVKVTLKSELTLDEKKNEFVESDKDIKDVMTVKDNTVTFSKEGLFLAEVSIKDKTFNVIFDVNEEALSYVDLNDWVVANGTSSPDFSVKYDSKEITTVKVDTSDVHVDTTGEYVLTYEITDINNKKIEKNVLVTVVEKETVNEYVEKGVWEAQRKIIINDNNELQSDKSYKNPVVKPSNQNSNNGSNNQNNNQSSNQDNNKPNKPEKPQHVHAFGDWQVKKAATCEKTGLEERFCTDTTCNKKEVRKTPALGHDFVDYVSNNDATCTENGTETAKCTRCDKTDTRTAEGTALGHDLKEEILENATCETAGSKKVTCSHGDYEEIVEIPATGHEFVDYKYNDDATCEQDGTETAKCTNCDKTDTRTAEGTALGHDFVNYVSNNNATCTEDATETGTCSRCDETDTRPIAGTALGHDWSDWEVKDATCTEDGSKTRHCEREDCTEVESEIIPATGHDWSDWDIKDSTCGQEGEKTRHCERTGCTATETVKIPASENHKWNDGQETKAATCTEQGEVTYTCNDCGHTKVEKTPALGHDLKEVILKQPTCSESGLKAMVCQRPSCDHKEKEVSIPATGEHHWDAGVVTKQPTCIEKGQKTYTCEHCGEKKYEEIGLIEHIWEEIWEKGPDKTVTEVHAFCGGCGKDFGPGPEGAEAALEHTMMDFNDGCSNYYADEVTVTIPGEDILVGHKCKMCGKKDY